MTKSTKSDIVFELQSLLFESYPVGSTLPAEASLGEALGVSRLTIRESLKVLAGRGLVELRQGRKAVVTEPSSEVISSIFAAYVRRDPSALLELVEVRQALEVQSVSLAARKANRAGLAAIESALALMKQSAISFHDSDPHSAGQTKALANYQFSDIAFHGAIALSTGNRMLSHVLEALEESLLLSFTVSFEGHLVRGGTALDTYESHYQIFQFIKAGEATKAAQAMRTHLEQADRDLRAALTESSIQGFVRPNLTSA